MTERLKLTAEQRTKLINKINSDNSGLIFVGKYVMDKYCVNRLFAPGILFEDEVVFYHAEYSKELNEPAHNKIRQLYREVTG
ncbi:hypothetical protein J4429_01510 [Candidatus Pacearchaeota archaeon]|nr:hypothetical protein [Candidatus Pacearchaeota archaeon]